MSDWREEAKFFGGSQYLERLDGLLTAFNEYLIMEKPEMMFKILRAYRGELDCYMTDQERQESYNMWDYAEILWRKYLEEMETNKKKNLLQKQVMGIKVYYNTTAKKRFMDWLEAWRDMLQQIQRRSGLLMQDKEDLNTAFQRGLTG